MGDIHLSVTSACLVLLALITGQVLATGLGHCPTIPPVLKFDISKMLGTWYEVERSFYLMELQASCTKVGVTMNERGNLLFSIDSTNRWTCTTTTTEGVGILNLKGGSTFRYRTRNRMPYLLGRLMPGAGDYHILATDYKEFAIIYSCTNLGIAHSDRIWVLGRTRELTPETRAKVYAFLLAAGLDPDRLILSKNTDCDIPHYTVP